MNAVSRLAVLSFVVIFFSGVCLARKPKEVKVPEVLKMKYMDGWYKQDHSSFQYFVDTKAKVCYVIFRFGASGVGYGGLEIIDSEKLKNREEWKEVITW